ncbi:hypothetical protein OBK28_11310 [Empedobacter falsenii]|uniref:DUF4169 family protein n=1 Tax=Empedobacter falsenii TaxID=343874 RepID=A0ABY8VA26_9FLAO|nr:hypothetical protein [Empedobacter falsenii]WIH97104.1 hypothetical protein OBA43_12800 [Empedobacter falsenii]
MSRNTDANKKAHKKKLDQKKRKVQDAEAERKARLKEINQQFNDKTKPENEE